VRIIAYSCHTQRSTVPIIFPLNRPTNITAVMQSIGQDWPQSGSKLTNQHSLSHCHS